jgi:hypothetical protein
VVESALTYSLTMVGAMNVYEHVFESGPHSISLFRIIFYLLLGLVCGPSGWDTRERKYKNALINARVNASPSGTLHNNPSGIH